MILRQRRQSQSQEEQLQQWQRHKQPHQQQQQQQQPEQHQRCCTSTSIAHTVSVRKQPPNVVLLMSTVLLLFIVDNNTIVTTASSVTTATTDVSLIAAATAATATTTTKTATSMKTLSESSESSTQTIDTVKMKDDNAAAAATGGGGGGIAIVHIGPLKTGTTSLQMQMKSLTAELFVDHYEFPVLKWGDINMGNVRTCFVNASYVNPITKKPTMNRKGQQPQQPQLLCDEKQYDKIISIATKKHNNIIITAETFSFPDTNVQLLHDTLTQYYDTIVVVMYYRRYYEWLVSTWNQIMKERVNDYTKRESFFDWIWHLTYTSNDFSNSNRNKNGNNPLGGLYKMKFDNDHYTYALVPRYQQYFDTSATSSGTGTSETKKGSSIMKVYNLHDETKQTNIEKFFCDALINATTACSKIKEQQQQRESNSSTTTTTTYHRSNESKKLVYEDIAYAAITMKLVPQSSTETGGTTGSSSSSSASTVTTTTTTTNYTDYIQLGKIIQHQQENVWNLTHYNISSSNNNNDYWVCLPDDILHDLYNKTVLAEQTLFPEYYKNHKDELYEQYYNIDIAQHKLLCTLDAFTMLEEDTKWIQFFQSLH